jgi:hypothetical protein
MFLTGEIQKPTLEWYWSTRGILLTPIFSQTMSRNRFQISQDMIEEGKKLKKGEVTLDRKQDVLLVTHQDKRLVTWFQHFTLQLW